MKLSKVVFVITIPADVLMAKIVCQSVIIPRLQIAVDVLLAEYAIIKKKFTLIRQSQAQVVLNWAVIRQKQISATTMIRCQDNTLRVVALFLMMRSKK